MTLQSFHYGADTYEYSICHIPRRAEKIAIHVFPNGAIQVDAPEKSALPEIKKAVLKRSRWIARNVQVARERLAHILPREYNSGESHFYLGRRHVLKVHASSDDLPSVKLLRGKLEVVCKTSEPGDVRKSLMHWYRARAAQIFHARLMEKAARISWVTEAPKLKLLTMKKQWGSCSSSGTIILNPHLVKAHRECVDYVILHELCHLKEHNHSPRFYRELDRHMPNWRSVKGRLDGMSETILAI
ncbi:SprT family zinc-dependent metalloprotease [Paremcibacter congregatus]|uniref:M48 family metallopeptidase n=1 Tax=Paremcibacter congregatus TaxID=2043170 RepID=UPI0030EED36C